VAEGVQIPAPPTNQRKRGFNMGGFVTDETGKVVMHISSPDILTQESIDFWEKEYGMKMTCSKCAKNMPAAVAVQVRCHEC